MNTEIEIPKINIKVKEIKVEVPKINITIENLKIREDDINERTKMDK